MMVVFKRWTRRDIKPPKKPQKRERMKAILTKIQRPDKPAARRRAV